MSMLSSHTVRNRKKAPQKLLVVLLGWLAIPGADAASAEATGAEKPVAGPSEATQAALRECAFAAPPGIIDGALASRQEMEEVGAAVRAFVADMQGSLDCLDRLAARVPEPETPYVNTMYNNGVDQLNFIVDHYNEQVQLFRRYDRIQPR